MTKASDALTHGSMSALKNLMRSDPALAEEILPSLAAGYNNNLTLWAIRSVRSQGKSLNAVRDADNNTPQHWSAMCGITKSLKLLGANGADFTVRNNLGTTPVLDCMKSNRPDALAYILSMVGNEALKHRNCYGADAICHGAYTFADKNLNYVFTQTDGLANSLVNTPNPAGYTPLDLAEKRKLELDAHSRASGVKPPEYVGYENTKATLMARGAEHGALWNSQTPQERLAYDATNAKLWEEYKATHYAKTQCDPDPPAERSR